MKMSEREMATSTSAPFDGLSATERFYTMVKSLREFDKLEVKA
jgi:hypothetical protein